MPFDNSITTFKVDLVNDDKDLSLVREIMAPANASVFWQGGGPFGPNDDQQMYIPRFDASCKYYALCLMIFRWRVPTDVGNNSTFRLEMSTEKPPTTHVSGKLRISDEEENLAVATGWTKPSSLPGPSFG